MSDSTTIDDQLAHYQLQKALGRGGMGQVTLALDTRLQRQVAIKRLLSDSNTAQQQRLQREAAALAQINHPHVVQLYDILQLDDATALVMEYVDGADLKQYLKEHLVSLQQRLQWLVQISQGLAAIHAQGIIHRDLKAENILISQERMAKITDLGIAKVQSDNNQAELTATGQLIGSFSAFSPEQALGKALNERSDLFSFGILAFRLLCGSHPFGDSSQQQQLLQNILHHAPLAAGRLNPDLPQPLQQLLQQLLQKDPAQRPASAQWVSEQLQTLLHTLPAHAQSVTGTETLSELPSAQFSALHTTGLDHSSLEQQAVLSEYAKNTAYQPASAALSANQSPTVPPFKRSLRTGLIASLMLLLIAALAAGIYAYWPFKQAPSNRYVAVLPPEINTDSPMSAGQQALVIDTLAESLEQQILSSPALQLISPRDVAKTSGSYGQRAAAVAADMLIASELDCAAQRCDIRLSRVEAKNDDNGRERWAVQQQQQWPALIDDQYRNLGLEAAARLSQLLPDYLAGDGALIGGGRGAAQRLSEADYQAFIELRHAVMITGLVQPAQWQQLVALQNQLGDYLPFYEVASFLGLLLFDDTQEPRYLNELLALLQGAEQRLGPQLGLLDKQFELYLRQQAFEQAEALITTMQNLGADAAMLATERGLLANYQGRFTEATAYYQQAIALAPTTGRWYEMAHNYFWQGDYAAALTALEQLAELDPNYSLLLDLRSEVYLYSGQLDKAIDGYKLLLQQQPSAITYTNLSLAQQLAGRFSAAKTAATKAVRLAPKYQAGQLNLADSQSLTGDWAAAKAGYQAVAAASVDKQDYYHRYIYAQAQAQLGNHSAAFKAMHQALRQWPDNPEVLFSAALVYTLAEQWPVAISYAGQSLAQGLSPVFYQLPWFAPLCAQPSLANEAAVLATAVCAADPIAAD